MLCNFCGKTLDPCDEANLGDLTVRFFYGSKRDGDRGQPLESTPQPWNTEER